MKRKFIKIQNIRMVPVFGAPSCGAETLPEVDFDFCDPEVKLSEIQRIFLRKVGSSDFDDWTQPGEWETRCSESSTDDDAIRVLTVIADKPAPATTKKTISNGRIISTRKEHTINATVDEVTDANHEFLRQVEGGKRFIMNYETAGGFMFGGNDGIAIQISGDMLLPRGQGEIGTYQYQIIWATSTTEERCLSPIFQQTLLGSNSFDTMISFASDSTPANGASDWILVGGVNAVAKFEYNEINPTIGAVLVMTVKVSGVLKLTMNTTADFTNQPFKFTDIAGVVHEGLIKAGDVLF